MSLVEVALPKSEVPPPAVETFLREAERRIERFQRASSVPGFVASDYRAAWAVLNGLSDAGLASGDLFCEWGSGFGVVACLAAMLGFEAYGIEAEGELVQAARDLAAAFDVPVTFAHASFLPGKLPAYASHRRYSWLVMDVRGAEALDWEPGDFDVIYAYPWPDEETAIERIFERSAREGALLVSYHENSGMRVQRKRGTRSR